MTTSLKNHPFIHAPHKTVLTLSIPVLFSMIAEPLTGLVDTAFVAQLGAEALAALGVGTAALTSIFWIFNFLGIGTQTEVAQALGQERQARATRMAGLALVMSGAFGLLLIVIGFPFAPTVAGWLGAEGVVLDGAVEYMRIRMFSAPAMLAIMTAFGALRGLQDMRTPLWIAITINAINIGLDALLVIGFGPVPAMGIAGVALASVLAQWIGAVWAVTTVIHKLGWPKNLKFHEARRLLKIGGDLFIRTGLLTLYMLLTTRVATTAGANSGAAHQAIRQFWTFAALGLDALAITAQSLVGFFIGSGWSAQAKRVSLVCCQWGIGLGILLSVGMLLGQKAIIDLLVPETAVSVFVGAWFVSAIMQPINSLSFVTDGIHWGTGDFRYLRNGMMLATAVAGIGLLFVDTSRANALLWVWAVTAVWIIIRAVWGVIRIWPGVGETPFSSSQFSEGASVMFTEN